MVGYASDFNLTESPISEGKRWQHNGTLWTLVNTSGGIAFGTQTGSGAFDDSYAYVTGFPADQEAHAVIHLDTSSFSGGEHHEVELLFRWQDTVGTSRGYELNLAWDGAYADSVRWNGLNTNLIAQYTSINTQIPAACGAPKNGDLYSGTLIGNTLTAYLNGVAFHTVDITSPGGTVWTDGGGIGMGFFHQEPGGTRSGYGFNRFTAVSVPSSLLASPPINQVFSFDFR